MPLQKVALRPGIQGMASQTANEGGWSASNLVRFRQGLPEKWRGWKRYLTTTFQGKIRNMLVLYGLAGDTYLTIGTSEMLYMLRGGIVYDITPVDRTLTIATNGVATTSGSTTVTITTTTPHALKSRDIVTLDTINGQARTPSAATVGGIALGNRDYRVLSITSGTAFTVTAPTAATSTATGGSAGTVTCFLAIGTDDATSGLGWGSAGYGSSPFGQASNVAANTLPARMWSLEAWGQTLLACSSTGRLLSWSPDAAGNVTTRAAYVTNTITPANGPPLQIGGCVVGMPERHAMLMGCSDLNSASNFDPLLVRFSDVEDYSVWNAAATNSAGSFRLQGGGQIMAWLNSTLQTLIWTDSSLWTCRFVGLPYVYSFNKTEGNCGIVSQNARAEMGGTVYWMGPNGFWAFRGGAPAQLACTLQDSVFDSLNRAQQTKITCGVNTANGEVMWFYPVSAEVDRFVCFNTRENIWYGGQLARSVWLDRGMTGVPLAASPDGKLYLHETGTDADGAAMGEWIESGYFDLDDGENLLFIDRFIPDFQSFTGSLTVTIKVVDYPSKAPRVLGPYTVTPETRFVPFRCRGRQAAMRIEGGGVGAWWRLGAPRFNIQPDGMR